MTLRQQNAIKREKLLAPYVKLLLERGYRKIPAKLGGGWPKGRTVRRYTLSKPGKGLYDEVRLFVNLDPPMMHVSLRTGESRMSRHGNCTPQQLIDLLNGK